MQTKYEISSFHDENCGVQLVNIHTDTLTDTLEGIEGFERYLIKMDFWISPSSGVPEHL